MVAQEETLVRRADHHCVPHHLLSFEIEVREKTAYVLVDGCNGLHVPLQVVRIFELAQRFLRYEGGVLACVAVDQTKCRYVD